ncbi:MAG: hypothetical protein QNI99_08745 [Woeseiaceae bacterium]|nr:hypothetical protein [Woeseiaceae bacterium]
MLVPILALCACAAVARADSLEAMAERAAADIVYEQERMHLKDFRAQLHAPGKSEEEREAMISDALHALAACKVTKGIEYAREHDLPAESVLGWLASWELSAEYANELSRLDIAAFYENQKPCADAFFEALPMRDR